MKPLENYPLPLCSQCAWVHVSEYTHIQKYTQSPDQSRAICPKPDDEYENWQTIRQLISSTLNAVCFSVCGLCVYLRVCMRRKVCARPSVCAPTSQQLTEQFQSFQTNTKNVLYLTTGMQPSSNHGWSSPLCFYKPEKNYLHFVVRESFCYKMQRLQ